MKYLYYYLIAINVISFFMYGIDKWLAIHKKYRISEFKLLFSSFMGGVIGALLGMFIFHHKTKKIKFYLGNVFFLGIWVYFIGKLVIGC